ncbi:hypothetical protein Lal_00050131 [Lupinus albus]|nr:hypothetical protein Lal_00050131 [Lupinus albus]
MVKAYLFDVMSYVFRTKLLQAIICPLGTTKSMHLHETWHDNVSVWDTDFLASANPPAFDEFVLIWDTEFLPSSTMILLASVSMHEDTDFLPSTGPSLDPNSNHDVDFLASTIPPLSVGGVSFPMSKLLRPPFSTFKVPILDILCNQLTTKVQCSPIWIDTEEI